MASKEVDQTTATAVATVPPAVAAMVMDLKTMVTENEDSDPNAISMDILERILTADTLEDAMSGTTALESLIQVPLSIDVRSWQASTQAELGVFAVMDCIDDAGKKYVVTCGGRNVIAILYRAYKEERLPLRGMFMQRETNQGFTVIWIDILAD